MWPVYTSNFFGIKSPKTRKIAIKNIFVLQVKPILSIFHKWKVKNLENLAILKGSWLQLSKAFRLGMDRCVTFGQVLIYYVCAIISIIFKISLTLFRSKSEVRF
jgi:hypothetical protein